MTVVLLKAACGRYHSADKWCPWCSKSLNDRVDEIESGLAINGCLDGMAITNVASREPDGMWACCLCAGWGNRACDDDDYKFTKEEILHHLVVEHNIPIRNLYAPKWDINLKRGK